MKLTLNVSNDDTEWDLLVRESPQGSLFSSSAYLKVLGVPFARYMVRKSNNTGEILAGIVVIEKTDPLCMDEAPFPYTPYQGILFASKHSSVFQHKRITSEYRVTEFLIHTLYEIYANFNMALSPEFKDIRAFLWHNYHALNQPHFLIQNRYTAILDLKKTQEEDYLKSIRTVRRQEAKKSVAQISETEDIALFLDIYQKMFIQKEIQVTSVQINLIEDICASALSQGFGRLSMATTEDGVASMSLFLYDEKSAYYLFGANDPSQRKSGGSTKLMIDNIQTMRKYGIPKLDFIGVNSPNRGDFKISFNPNLIPYYEVSLGECRVFDREK